MKTGKVSENVLKRSVLRQLHKTGENVLIGAGIGEDCAIFSFSGADRFASCMQEGSALYPGDEGFMRRLVIKCANNLAASGGIPAAVSITLLLPEEAEEATLKQLMKQAADACGELHMDIAGGQTSVSRSIMQPTAVVTGYASFPADAAVHNVRAAAPGQDIVISKWIGLEGTALLAAANRSQLLERYPAYLVDEAAGFDRYLSLIPEAATAVKSGVCAMHDASRGGIFGALWELAEGAGAGLAIDLKKLPLRQETVEVCEVCNVNPYELLSGGCLVMTTRDGVGLTAALQAAHIPAVIVGKLTDGKDRILRNDDEIRYLDKPKQDAIYGVTESRRNYSLEA